MLELAILGLLQDQAMHGYELNKQLTQKLGHFWRVSYGSLYPALKRMEERGAIEPVFNDEATRRSKNVYRITDRGRHEFLELIEDTASTTWEEEKFPLRFAFFRYVKPEIRLRLLERRRVYLEDKLDDLRRSMRQEQGRIDGYTLSLMHHGMEATASDIAWLDELIAAERRQLPAEPERREEDPAPGPPSGPRRRERGTDRQRTTKDAPPNRPPGERAAARSR
ncbi:MAG TPA: PadR family transcriptional regulator [Nitriliruptorales bacterium]|nr:PadR family transcriptional regulator [Nitriliruptorales bacterium]